MKYRIDNTFEIPSQEEWDKHLSSSLFEGMLINPKEFTVSQDFMSQIVFGQGICNYIRQHNNKVGTLKVSYTLCKHYYDKNIPDDPWYISPGRDGQSIQYMPKFQPKDWLIRYWFSYFLEVMYFKVFSIWDSVVGLINEYYQLGCKQNIWFRSNVMKYLKSNRKDIYKVMMEILDASIYKEANMYRTRIVHGATPNDVSSGINLKTNSDIKIFDGIKDGKPVMRKTKAAVQLSAGVGKYTDTKTLMNNIEEFCKFTGEKIRSIVEMIKEDGFSIKI